jgi:hypothetical protein
MSTRQFEVDNESDLPSPVIAEIVERFCRETPTIPRGSAAVAMLRTSRGNYKIDAFPDTQTIRVAGPYTEEAIDAYHELAAHLGTELITTSWDSEDVSSSWRVQLDPLLTEAWQRNDPLVPSERNVKACISEIVERVSHQQHGQCTVVTQRPDDQPEDFRRVVIQGSPETRLIRAWILQNAEAEKEVDDFMNGPEGTMLNEGPTLLRKGDDVAFVTLQ